MVEGDLGFRVRSLGYGPWVIWTWSSLRGDKLAFDISAFKS